jgi:16S rRNA (guanine527-N7)-methyltransferase
VTIEKSVARVIDALDPAAKTHAPALVAFVKLLQTWNAKIDLTAARTPAALADVLVADALVMADEAFVPKNAHLFDVGSGAGAPALPLAIVRPDLRITMLEPLQKRVAFLRTAIGTLGLAPRVSAIAGRLELDAPTTTVAPDVTSARATFAPEDWLRAGLALAPRVLVLTTGAPPPSDPRATLAHRRGYAWPGSGAPRELVRFDRIG